MNNYFFCYNKHLADYIRSKGIQYITVARDLKSQKIFTLFYINEMLQQTLAEYKQLQK